MSTRPLELKAWKSPFLDTLSSVATFSAHGDIHGYVPQDQTPQTTAFCNCFTGIRQPQTCLDLDSRPNNYTGVEI